MHAIGTHAEKRHRPAVEAKNRRLSPVPRDIKGLAAPFRDAPLGDQRFDDPIDGAADRFATAVNGQPRAIALDLEDLVIRLQ